MEERRTKSGVIFDRASGVYRPFRAQEPNMYNKPKTPQDTTNELLREILELLKKFTADVV